MWRAGSASDLQLLVLSARQVSLMAIFLGKSFPPAAIPNHCLTTHDFAFIAHLTN
jgi:hypothetical protein